MILIPLVVVGIIVLIVLRLLASALSSIGGGGGRRGHGHGGHGGSPNGQAATPNGQSPQKTIYPFKKAKRRSWWGWPRRLGRRSPNNAPAGVPAVPARGFASSDEEQRFAELCEHMGYAYDSASQQVYEDPDGHGAGASTGFGGFLGFCQMCFWIGLLLFLFTLLPHS